MKVFLFSMLLLGTAFFSSAQSPSGEINGGGLSFISDYTFKGSALTGWKTLGGGNWSARNGEMIGTVKQGSVEGWLMLDRSFQDIGINTLIKISGGSEAGILLRAEKSGAVMKGVLVSINNDS